MTKKRPAPTAGAWDLAAAEGLIDGLWALRRAMRDNEARLAPRLAELDAAHRGSAVNLAHYLAMRQVDLRPLQDGLAWMGLSSLGRAEPAVLARLRELIEGMGQLIGEAAQKGLMLAGDGIHLTSVGYQVRGRMIADAGAARALTEGGKSLLPAGVVGVEGDFERGQTVRIYSGAGAELARGLAQYSARDLRLIKGLRSAQIGETLGYDYGPEVVHRDDMVLL